MRDSAYLIINQDKIVAMRKQKPQLSSGQVAVQVHVNLPDAYFKRFIPEATLEIPEAAVLRPPVEVALNPKPAEFTPETIDPSTVVVPAHLDQPDVEHLYMVCKIEDEYVLLLNYVYWEDKDPDAWDLLGIRTSWEDLNTSYRRANATEIPAWQDSHDHL